MTHTTDNIPASLKKDLKEGNVVPFIGAGVSKSIRQTNEDGTESDNSLFPTWKEFVQHLADVLEKDNKCEDANLVRGYINIKKPKYLEALQHAQEELPRPLWNQAFSESFDKTKNQVFPASLKLPELIWQLSNNLIITTNIDRALHWTCPQSHDVKSLDVQYTAYAQLQKESYPTRPTVWHLHGSIDHIENVIFTRQQFEDFYKNKNNEAKLQTLLTFLTQKTFLFIGFSLDDDYLREVLEYIERIYQGGAGSYYILFREKDIPAANFPKEVTVVPFSEFGKPLEDKIEELIAIATEGKNSNKKDVDKITNKSANPSVNDERAPFFNVPFASKEEGFIGRKDKLTEIHKSLTSGAATHIGQAQNIQGMGGLGKTQLAVEYAHRYRNEYQRGIYWLTADADINNQLITIGEAERWIFRDDKAVNQFDVAKARFLELKDCLIIFDNVESVDDIKPFIPADKKSVHLLITSREEQNGFKQIDLNVLSPGDSKELLLSITGRKPSDEAEEKAFEQLIEELDGLPLALELVGGYLAKRKNISFQNYLRYFNTEPLEKIEARFPDETFTNHDISIIRTLTISEELLNETLYLADILDVLAWSGSSPMSVSLLREMIQPESEFEFEDALALARELKLLKKDDEAERYAIHRLLGRVRRLEKPLNQNHEWHRKTLNGLVKWFRKKKDNFNNLIEFEDMLEHLEKWESQSSDSFITETVNLIWLKAYPLWHRGNPKDSKTFLKNSIKAYEDNSINNSELQANIIADLGVINNDLGNHQKALEYEEKALVIRKELFGDNHPDTATSYNNIGITYSKLENDQKALEYKEKALVIRKELFGDNHPNTADSYSNVGITYSNLRHHQKALEYKEKALKIRKELFGDNHPDTANSYSNVGITYDDLGNHQKALEYEEKALIIQRSFLGKQHPNTIILAKNLIILLHKFKNFIKAGQLANEYFKDVPQNHPNWKIFEELSRPYRKKRKSFKKKRK